MANIYDLSNEILDMIIYYIRPEEVITVSRRFTSIVLHMYKKYRKVYQYVAKNKDIVKQCISRIDNREKLSLYTQNIDSIIAEINIKYNDITATRIGMRKFTIVCPGTKLIYKFRRPGETFYLTRNFVVKCYDMNSNGTYLPQDRYEMSTYELDGWNESCFLDDYPENEILIEKIQLIARNFNKIYDLGDKLQ